MNKDCFSYLVVNDSEILGFIKELPPLPHTPDSTVRIYCCNDCNDYQKKRIVDINGKIVPYSLGYILDHKLKVSGCQCGGH